MTRRPGTVVFDNEAVQALLDVGHPKHVSVLAVLEVANQRRSRKEQVALVVPTAARVEAGWDRTAPGAAAANRLSRAVDVTLDTGAANRCVALRRLVPEASVVDVTVADAAASAPLQPATIVTSDADDFIRLAGHLAAGVVIAVI